MPGKDPSTNKVPDDPQRQVEFAFNNAKKLLENAGAKLEDVVQMKVYISDESMRPILNTFWLQHFPDAGNRPARHTVVMALPSSFRIQLECMAVI